MQNVRDTKRWRKANKRVWWFYLPRDFSCKDSLLGVRGNADEVAHVFHFLYCGLDEHGFVDHAEQIIFVQQYQKTKLSIQWLVHFNGHADVVRRHLFMWFLTFFIFGLVCDDDGCFLYGPVH